MNICTYIPQCSKAENILWHLGNNQYQVFYDECQMFTIWFSVENNIIAKKSIEHFDLIFCSHLLKIIKWKIMRQKCPLYYAHGINTNIFLKFDCGKSFYGF